MFPGKSSWPATHDNIARLDRAIEVSTLTSSALTMPCAKGTLAHLPNCPAQNLAPVGRDQEGSLEVVHVGKGMIKLWG
jgi:hypothetical protein